MKIVTLFSLFFILSTLLIVFALTEYMQNFSLSENKKEIKVEKSKKSYLKRRDEFVPVRTLSMAQKKIDKLLETKSYLFENKSIDLEQNSSNKERTSLVKATLSDLVKILNHLDEDAILIVNTWSKNKGSNQHNLKFSQHRADSLKEYFRKRTSLPLIVAIGYVGKVPLKKEDKTQYKQVEINLKRIK